MPKLMIRVRAKLDGNEIAEWLFDAPDGWEEMSWNAQQRHEETLKDMLWNHVEMECQAITGEHYVKPWPFGQSEKPAGPKESP